MADSPSTNSKPSSSERDPVGAWHQPDVPGGWRAPQASSQTESDSGGWRVPALPQDLDVEPVDQGTWHLPRPEDTTFQPTDELEIDATSAGTPTALPFDDIGGRASAPPKDAADSVPPTLAVIEDDDDDSFSMSELIALASLVEDQPSVPVTPAEAAESDEQPDAADPAEYARRQLERLQQGNGQDAAAGAAAEPAPSGEAEVGTSALAQKYRDTETRVRDLRRQYQAGTITRDQLQAELRRLMVLDENQVWWMLGIESDNWYKFDNGQWVQAIPPALSSAASGETEPGPGPDAGDNTIRTSPLETDPNYMPLPRPVPVRDPDFTLPGTAGVYLPPVPADLGVTQPTLPQQSNEGVTIASPALSDATVASSPVAAPGAYEPVPSPVPAGPAVDPSKPPSYDLSRPSPLYEQVMQKQRQQRTRALIIVAVVGVAFLFLLGACGIVAGLAYYSSLASPWQDEIAALADYQPQFQTARILDAEGNLIVELTSSSGGAREKVALRDISPFFIHAVIATENERFYDDPGWDAIAIARAIIQNITAGEIESGASTITQQIARNLILQDTTVSNERKLQEIVIASEIAQRYDKNFILELYLNEVFFGNRSYGVEAAAEFYFNKHAADLNMAESALLAGMIQAPATYDPVVNSQAAFDRMDTVLGRMRRVGCIQFQHEPYLGEPFCIRDAQIRLDASGEIVGGDVLIERALVETSSFRPREYTVRYPHFVNFVQAQIEQSFGAAEMFRRGFTVRTTLIPRIQDTAQAALARYISAAAGTGLNTGAVLVTDPTTGAIRAMVGSPDFNNADIDGQVNNVLTWQQSGSSIKPVVYAAGLEGVLRNGQLDYLTPATILWDVPTTYNTQPPYTPVNYDRQYHGPVALRYALGNSYNVPAVKALEFIGLDKFREVATRMGLRFLEDTQFGLPSALGSNEIRLYDHVQAYGTLANGGMRVPLFAITSITDADGNQVPLPERPEPVAALSPQVAFLLSHILADNQARAEEFGLNSGLTIPGYDGLVAAKTGTSNDGRDLWTMGYTTNFVVGVWTGTVNNDATSATTSTAAIPIWNEVMRAALQGNPPQPFPNPGGIAEAEVCGETGTLYDAAQECPTVRRELFLQSQPPPPASQAFVQTAAVDTWTGMRANQYCGEFVETRRFVNITDPTAVQWLSSPEGQAYAAALGLPSPAEPPPQGECTPNMQRPSIQIAQPAENQQVQGLVQVLGAATGPNFNRYQLEIASVNNPDAYTIVDGPHTTPQNPGGVLGQWNTTQFPNGLYRLRLAVFANDGGYAFKTITLGVNNPQPTAVPTAEPTAFVAPTIDANNGNNPLPFDIQISTAPPQPTPDVPGL